MFGYLVAAPELMTEPQLGRYRAAYCGLCRSLRARHGQISGLTLTYDMTFLVLFLSSLYEPEETTGEDTCAVHPFKAREWVRNAASDYAADMNLALAYQKCMDDWEDDGSVAALVEAGLMKRSYKKLEAQYPRQCAAIAEALNQLHEVEKSVPDGADEAAACFGALMAEIFVWREDRWGGAVRGMANALGKFIYVMDACMDLDKDTLYSRYNPFRKYYGLTNNAERFRDILRMLLGECIFYFDSLPLVQDADIMKNILCEGLWQQFNKKFSEKNDKKEPSDVSGSV